MQTYKKYLRAELKIAINYCLFNIAIVLMVEIRNKEGSSH